MHIRLRLFDWQRPLSSLIWATVYFTTAFAFCQTPSTLISLSPTTGPGEAQPGVTTVGLTGTQYPSGTINSSQIQLTLSPAAPATGSVITFSPISITTVTGTTRRIAFTIPTSISVVSSTSYLVSVSGQTQDGVPFSSANSAALIVDPPAQVISTSPSSAAPGQSRAVTLSGRFTNFTQNSTVANFGPGISVGGSTSGTYGPIAVIDDSTATAQIQVDAAAVLGLRAVSVQTGTQIATLPNGFAVATVAIPSLTSVTPNAGASGQSLSIFIAGSLTHFVQGTTSASFGEGISISSLVVNSATSATAVVNIDPGAVLGTRDITVTTGGEVASGLGEFAVVAGLPSIVSINPNSSPQGKQGLSVMIAGQNTHFIQGTTTATFGPGITVVALSIASANSASAILNIDPNTSVGSRNVSLTTGTETVSLSNSFTITAANPGFVVSAGPNQSVAQSWDLFVSSNSCCTPYGDTPPIGAPEEAVLRFDGSSGKFLGKVLRIPTTQGMSYPRELYIDGQNRLYVSFRSFPINPFLGGINRYDATSGAIIDSFIPLGSAGSGDAPAFTVGPDGQFYLGIENDPNLRRYDSTTGAFLNLFGNTQLLGITSIVTGPDGNFYTAGANKITKVDARSGAFLGYALLDGSRYDQPVVYDAKFGPDGFLYSAGGDADNVLRTDPTTGLATKLIIGENSGLVRPNSIAFGPDGNLYVGDTPLNNNGQVIRYNSQTGAFIDKFISIGTGGMLRVDGLLFNRIGDLAVLSGSVTQNNKPVNSVTASWSKVSGPGTVQFADASALNTTAVFSAQGTYVLRLSASAAGQSGTSDITILVTQANRAPVVNAGADQTINQPALAILTGQATDDGLPSGGGALSYQWSEHSGPGLVTFSTPTHASTTASFSAPGVYTLALSASDSQLTGVSYVFITVADGSASFLNAVTPDDAQQGQQMLLVYLSGVGTHWTQGVTTASFGSGITVSALTVTSATNATATLNIGASATIGPRGVTVTTGNEVEVVTAGFNVTAGAPFITTISPNFGPQGLSGPVAVIGQNTNFAQGVTTLDFGPGITVSNITVGCPTCLTATLAVNAAAAPGLRTVTATTGSEVASLVDGFTVVAVTSSPILTSLTPTNVYQGQSLTVSITGQSTHFVQGTTQVSFGSSVTTTGVTVISATSLTAQITIDPSATVGLRAVTVTTGRETESSPSVFNIQAATPVIYLLNPGSGMQAQQNLSVAITGVSTHFVQGTTVASFGAGVTVTSLAVASPTSATAVVNIDPSAALGLRTVTLITGPETASIASAFAVTANTSIPLISGINPGGSSQGATNFAVSITGQNTHFAQGSSQATFGAGISVVSLTVASPTTATAVINIDPAAAIGYRTVSLTTGAETASFSNGFQVVAGVAGISIIAPSTGPQGGQSISISVTSQFTHWVQGTTQAAFGSGITVVSLTITSATTAQAVVNIDPAAILGVRNVTFTTGTEAVTAPGGFTVETGGSTLVSVSPNTGQEGQQNLAVTLTGQNTHFVQGTTQAFFGANIIIESVVVTSPTIATAFINISPSAATGLREVGVQTGSEVVLLDNIFNVTAPSPILLSGIPNAGQQAQQNLSVILTGQYTHFSQGNTTVTFGTGITTNSISVNSPTSITATINIAPAAVIGSRTITVSTGGETVMLANGFSIQAGTPSPISVSPSSGLQSQTLTVTITGQGSHFAQGTTQARFGPGVMVGGGIAGNFGPVSVVNSTTATAQLTILGSAMPAPRTVTIQTGSETLTGTNIFSVVGLPYLFSANPTFGNQGQTVEITVNGQYAHFLQGTTQASFGPGISVGGGPVGGLGNVTVNSPTSFTAQLVIDPAAVLGLRTILAQTGTEQASTSQNFSVLGPVIGPGPQVSITSPTEATDVTSHTTVTGTVTSPNLNYWTLSYLAPSATAATQFAQGTGSTVSATFDPTLLLNGDTLITLTAVDTSGQTASVSVNVIVSRNLKIGNFTVSFNDLSVPVAGLPIQVTRTYDSRYKSVGDFGYGWRLGVKAVQITENTTLGNNWVGTTSGGAFPTYCITASTAHNLTVSFADGITYEFAPTLLNGCQQFVPPAQVNVGFTPTGTTPPNASIAIAGNNVAYAPGAFPGDLTLYDQDDATVFDPDQYILTLPDGRTLQLSMQFGLQKMTDSNGNTLTISSSGITSSTGKSVTFQRDSQQRIQTITDPNGNALNYAYDANGDLVSYTDASNNTSTYTYDGNHDLLTIVDPAGAQPIRNDYDANGRLVSHTDAYGNVINYTNDPNTNQEIVTDRLGNVTVNEYDSAGNIVKITDALGGITTMTYDANGNVLTQTNAFGYTTTNTYDQNNNKLTQTDPLGNTTTYTYNNQNQVLTITDANNNVTTNIYDSNGNLTSTKDAAGNKTTYSYNSIGLQTSMTDPLNNVNSYQYDASGNLTQQTDALQHVTTYTYDNNGNKTSQTTTRTTTAGQQTLVTSYQYDNSNRLIQTTYPDNSTTQIQYNSIGKQGVTIDQLNRQTSYQYDLMGRLLQTTYPDATSDSSTYDAEGDRITSVDREQRTTSYVYDPLKRLYKTNYPDQASAQTGYDLIGEVTSTIDPLGNITQYKYDPAGRRTQVLDALSNATSFQYDPVGNQKSMTDANNNTTQYSYDQVNRRTIVTYADNTTDLAAYDPLGRTIKKTDQAGIATLYTYDPLGRLTQVTDALKQPTTYSYDEVGNRISQTDANGHTTMFAYDKLGRRIQRTLPAGQSESMTYDAAGNLQTKTDFSGKTTNYNYDPNNNWLTAKIPDPSFNAPTVSFTYTADGQRQSMVDSSGTTSYQYDLRDRLLQKTTPEGTLTYTYDAAGNLKTIRSSNTGGTSVDYSYDADNRLSTVKDNRLTNGNTTYTYDNAGNLKSYLYPNGVQTSYTYNSLNRLTNLGITSSSSTLASYAYQLGAAGNRTQVNEFGGRQVNYGYDNLYRLTFETIANDPASVNGIIGYLYDPVGNRQQRTSSVGPVSPASYNYDADDRLTSDTYDADGSTIGSAGKMYTYDFENHLIGQNGGQVAIIYDGDGNRVEEAAGGATTRYLVDDSNLTTYAQVFEELSGGAVQRVYTYGLSRISQSQASGTSFYEYDGHANVRILTDTSGNMTDQYGYDAFGNIISQAGTTPNVYLYSGEQNDPNLGFYYLRARYFIDATGRFQSTDPFLDTPLPIDAKNGYQYSSNDPVDRSDSSGLYSLTDETATVIILPVLALPNLIGTRGLSSVLDKALGREETPIPVFHYLTFKKLIGVVSKFGFIPVTNTDKPEDCLTLVGKDSCAYFSPERFPTSARAKDLLALPSPPAIVIGLNLFKQEDQPSDIRPALAKPGWGNGGGPELATPYGISLYPNRDVTLSTIQ